MELGFQISDLCGVTTLAIGGFLAGRLRTRRLNPDVCFVAEAVPIPVWEVRNAKASEAAIP